MQFELCGSICRTQFYKEALTSNFYRELLQYSEQVTFCTALCRCGVPNALERSAGGTGTASFNLRCAEKYVVKELELPQEVEVSASDVS